MLAWILRHLHDLRAAAGSRPELRWRYRHLPARGATTNTRGLTRDGVHELMVVLGQTRIEGTVQVIINPVAMWRLGRVQVGSRPRHGLPFFCSDFCSDRAPEDRLIHAGLFTPQITVRMTSCYRLLVLVAL